MAAARTPLPMRKSLRGKGLFATLALLAYVAPAGFYVAAERGRVLESVAALERLSQHDKSLALTEVAVSGALVRVRAVVDAADTATAPVLPPEAALYVDASARLFDALEVFDPAYALLHRAVQRGVDGVASSGAQERAPWTALRDVLARAADELEIRRRRLAEDRDQLTTAYQRQYDAVTVESLLLATIGLALFGSLAAWFFARLAGDIRRLEAHARQIVHGTRVAELAVRRDDELGQLMQAVNRMARELDERDKQIELDNQRRAHQDKMLSVGALAAGFSHEVNNPLAAITGAAQALRDAPRPLSAAVLDESVQLILTQADRASRAARQLAEVAAPEGAEPDWIDLNALVRRVVQLTAYDRRYRRLQFETQLDPDLPAVRTAGDALRQVLMQVLGVACDALLEAGQATATIALATAAAGRDIALHLSLPPVLDFTRPSLQRALLISRALIEPQGGRLAFGQDDKGLLRVKLTLPAESGD